MKTATARRVNAFQHQVRIRDHRLTVDEPGDQGGTDSGPSPQELLAASLASCTAITMGMYADRKGWEIGDTEVTCSYTPAERGCPTRFSLKLRFPPELDETQVQRLSVIAAKCPVHRTLEGEVMFEEQVDRLAATS